MQNAWGDVGRYWYAGLNSMRAYGTQAILCLGICAPAFAGVSSGMVALLQRPQYLVSALPWIRMPGCDVYGLQPQPGMMVHRVHMRLPSAR